MIILKNGHTITMSRYYSPLKEYSKYKRPKLFYRFVNIFIRKVIGRSDVVWLFEKSDEPSVYVCNHTRTYAPLAMELNFGVKTRPWVNAYMLTYRNCVKLLYHKIAFDLKPRFLIKTLAYILSPLIALYFRSLEPIPVYHDKRLKTTFLKTSQTLEEGIDIIIYPEKNIVSPNKFVNDMQTGFVNLARHYYDSTGRLVNFYPVYCCKDLKKILVGKPIQYDPEINIKEQREIIGNYLTDAINDLGASLPEHKVYLNKAYPPEINRYNF